MFGIALGVSEHVLRHFPFKIPGDLDIRSKAIERHLVVSSRFACNSRCVIRCTRVTCDCVSHGTPHAAL